MSTEIIGFDYSELQNECAVQVRAAAERIHLRTAVAVIENGKDLLAVRNMPEMKGRFVAWIRSEFNLGERTAYNMMQAAENLDGKFAIIANVGPTVLYALAAPSTPEDVREEVAARAIDGEKITVAEVERLKREAARAKEEAERLQAEREDWIAMAQSAAEREHEVREHLRLARKDAYAEAQKAGESARKAIIAEAEGARQELERVKAEMQSAIEKARAEAEEAARAKAEALAEEALAVRRGDLADIEARAKAAEEKARRHYEAERKLAERVEEHKDFLHRLSGAEAEATGALEAADKLKGALLDALLILQNFEHELLPHVARQWKIAGDMCRQLAVAIDTFQQPAPLEAIAQSAS
jgi:hypothetical protein